MRVTRHSFALVVALVSAQASAAPASACGSDLALALAREQTGQVSAQITINGKPLRFLVDTGANVNTLDTTQGSQLNLFDAASQGSARGERIVLSVAAAGHSLGDQQFAVMNLDFINVPAKRRYGTEPFVGQLGASFFEAFAARIDFGQMVLCIRPTRASSPK